MNYRFGITGDIASGKSTVSNYLSHMGFEIIDADKIAREVVEMPEVKKEISISFPDVYKYGKLDRKKLGRIVFSDNEKKKKLEKITHPHIKNVILEKLISSNGTVFLDAPLLFEGGYEKYLNEVIYITSDEKIRLERIIARDGISEEEARDRIDAFRFDREKKTANSYVIYNNSTKEHLLKAVDKFLAKYYLID